MGLVKKKSSDALPVEDHEAARRLTQRLGIVYTPVEIVDFIIHSVADVLREEFGKTMGDKNVHILDPFTGTGTFVTRLMQSKEIKVEQLPYKYQHEIHANEIVLLAYYIAAINIEAVYQDIAMEGKYQPFNGIVLTDTFQLYEQDKDMVANLLPDNSERRTAQRKRNITIIVGNPPYSAGQRSENDDIPNVPYENLDGRISKTYATASSQSMGKSKLYDSYIRAFRWASDRIGDEGVIGFVSGSAWVERNFADGMRKCLRDEFTKTYVVNLRGDIRKNILSKGAAREGGNVFGQNSMTGICITILVKKKAAPDHSVLLYDVGDNLSGEQKLAMLRELKSISSISRKEEWLEVKANAQNDWTTQRDEAFANYISISDKRSSSSLKVFKTYSMGTKSNRDKWVFNFSKSEVEKNMKACIAMYSAEQARLKALGDLHVNYESTEPYPVSFKEGDLRLASISDAKSFYRVEAMKFGGKRQSPDKTVVIYNRNITITNIPPEAYEYVVSGRPALEWVMERQCVSADKASGIINDANEFANETMNSPAYPLELFQRVITVSLKTMEIVRALPKLDIG